MAKAYPLPKWGLTMEEGIIVAWNVQPGDPVSEGDVIGLVATDKLELEFEAPVDGVVARHLVEEGATVAVGEDVIVIADDEDDLAAYRSGASLDQPHHGADERNGKTGGF
jgi:pyruvate/2-oxoglutarate dehydrogenase complex dihydrolipoamide acyltransferase (E2) component